MPQKDAQANLSQVGAQVTIKVTLHVHKHADRQMVARKVVEDIRTTFRFTRRAVETMDFEIE